MDQHTSPVWFICCFSQEKQAFSGKMYYMYVMTLMFPALPLTCVIFLKILFLSPHFYCFRLILFILMSRHQCPDRKMSWYAHFSRLQLFLKLKQLSNFLNVPNDQGDFALGFAYQATHRLSYPIGEGCPGRMPAETTQGWKGYVVFLVIFLFTVNLFLKKEL